MQRLEDGDDIVAAFNLPDRGFIIGHEVHIFFCLLQQVGADIDRAAAGREVMLVGGAVEDAVDAGGVDDVSAHRVDDVLAVGFDQAVAVFVLHLKVHAVLILD